jgi:small subunit ribosomal protein S3
MGNKSSARILRLGISQTFDADWYADKNMFAQLLSEDMLLRERVEKMLKPAGIARVVISRFRNCVELKITCLKPSIIVGKKGMDIEQLAKTLGALVNKEIRIKVFDIKKPELNALCVAKDIAQELQKKGGSTRKILKFYVQNAKRSGALGVRIECAGRLSGVEIARREWYQEGAVPRQKFRADIDYAKYDSQASWGISGVKVWIYKGDVIGKLGAQERERNA